MGPRTCDNKDLICPDGTDCDNENCNYSHSKGEQKKVLDKLSTFKTKMCSNGEKCENPCCPDAHRKFELRKQQEPMSLPVLEAAKQAKIHQQKQAHSSHSYESSPWMQIFVKDNATAFCKTIILDVSPKTTIGLVKSYIQDKLEIPINL